LSDADCPLCSGDGGEVLWRDDRLRIIAVDDADYPGFLRVIWNAHVPEMTDLSAADRAHCMEAVFAAEAALRSVISPDKINLAQFGNVVPHLHWHIIPRFRDDVHFPNPVWGARMRECRRESPGWRMSVGKVLEIALRRT
jgi:diadenosine tetraphosphate (Ap4A) HIT family hydrolase